MSDVPEAFSSIKQAAKFTGLSEDTIRYYEKIGLLPYADREANGRRTYNKHQLEFMVFLTRMKATGMTLEEIKRYRQLSSQGSSSIHQKISFLIEHKTRIQDEISRLQETEKIIDYKIDYYNRVLMNPDLKDSNCDPIEE